MHNQEVKLKDKFISIRIKGFKLFKSDSNLDFGEFDELLNFDGDVKHNVVKVRLERKSGLPISQNETIVLTHDNFLSDKLDFIPKSVKRVSNNIKKHSFKNQELDFSMFDDLIAEFEDDFNVVNDDSQKINQRVMTMGSKEIIDYLKKEISYYEEKIEKVYTLDNFETEEERLFLLRLRVVKLRRILFKIRRCKGDKSDFIRDEIINLAMTCKDEIIDLEKNLNIKRKLSNNADFLQDLNINDLDYKIESNLKVQDRFLSEIEVRIKNISDKVKAKIYLCMLKRMIFNLFKMIVGTYTIETSSDNCMKLTVGSFLVINSISGIKEAINLKNSKVKYYKYSDYTDSPLSDEENIELSKKIINQSIVNLDDLKKDLKLKFSSYKDYIHDYEEIYFKVDKIKSFLEYRQTEIQNNYVHC